MSATHEIEQIEKCYKALSELTFEGATRALAYLTDRIQHEHAESVQRTRDAQKAAIRKRGAHSAEGNSK